MSLRTAFTTITITLGALALGAAITLVTLTAQFRREADDLAGRLDIVRLEGQLKSDLLFHAELSAFGLAGVYGTISSFEVEQRLREDLTAARRHARDDEERAVLDTVGTAIEKYIDAYHVANAASPSLDALARSTAALLRNAVYQTDRLMDRNMAEVTATQEHVARWHRLAARWGTVAAIVLIVGFAVLLAAGRASVYEPIVAVQRAVRRYAAGDKQARLPVSGLSELREVARAFNEMAEALARQEERQLAFLAGVAHDLRNPLNALRLALPSSAPDRPLPPEERIRFTLNMAARQIDRLDRMIGDLLDATRIEAGQLELRMEDHDIRPLAEETVELFRTVSEAHTLVCRTPPRPVRVHCDSTRIEQVITNLVSNAIKYSPEGGRVEVTVSSEDSIAVVAVADQGMGIPPQDRAQVFEPFHRAGSSREAIPGVGLGLSVSRKIVLAHGGSIDFTSAPGAGSTFRVRLPLSRTAGVEPAPASS